MEHLGAHRETAHDDVGPCRVLLLGEDNPQSAAPEYALYDYPPGCAGNRLRANVFGISSNDYLAIWRTNLCCPSWSLPAARARWTELAFSPGVPWNVIVLLGSKVAKVALPPKALGPFSTCRVAREVDRITYDHLRGPVVPFEGMRLIYLPHPSGRNLVWNEPRNRIAAQMLMRECVPEIDWGRA